MPERACPEGTLLAFDFGLRRIGVAVGQTRTCTANALTTVINTGQAAFERVQALIEEWRPAALVVGLPLDIEGGETEMSRQARAFGGHLGDLSGLPVYFEDERLTSMAVDAEFAQQRAKGVRRRKEAAQKDAMAAKIILENWLQSHPAPKP